MLTQKPGLNHAQLTIHCSMDVLFVKPEKKLTTPILFKSSTTVEFVKKTEE
jgi:hypothetical protein